MYAIIDPEMSAKFKITISGSSGTDGVYYTSTNTYRNNPLMTTTAANYAASVDDMNNFSQTTGCDPDFSNQDMGEGGILSAYLVDASYTRTTTLKRIDGTDINNQSYWYDTCEGVEKMVGVQKMPSAVTISNETASINLALKVTDNAGLIMDSDGDGDPDFGYPGPWLGVLTTTERPYQSP
jgi:hypothetical protein